jgi:Tol biopolymer transport system component
LAVGATTAKFIGLSFGPGTPEHAAGMNQRHLWNAPPMSDLTGGISPDGRYLSYVDWTAGNLAVRDLITETSWLLTKNTGWDDLDGWAESSVVSPDGKQIAYAWENNEKDVNFYDLRIIDMDGTNLRVLYRDAAVFWVTHIGSCQE